jgi:bacterioferritin (cytochrome b1)
MEHDEMCYEQSRELALLAEQMRQSMKTSEEVVERVQDLVGQYHVQNTAQATMALNIIHIREKVDAIEESLKTNYAFRSEFKEIKTEWRRFLGIVLGTIAVGIAGWILKGGLQ